MTAFTSNERINLSSRVLASNVLDANPANQWYEAKLQYELTSAPEKIWLEYDTLKANPCSSIADVQAKIAAGQPLNGIVEDRVTTAVKMSIVTGSAGQTYVAYQTADDSSTPRLNNWIQPQSVPDSSGNPSTGFTVRLYNGDPYSGGTEILATDGREGTGADKVVAWTFNYSAGVLLIAAGYTSVITNPYITGFRYIGKTVADGGSGSGADALADLTDVNLNPAPMEGDGLFFDGSKWVAGVGNLAGLNDVNLNPPPMEGDGLFWDGSKWVAGVGNLAGLNDVNLNPPPMEGDGLFWDGSKWVAGVGNLSGLNDVNLNPPPMEGDGLFFDGTKWVAGVGNLAGLNDVNLNPPPMEGDGLFWDGSKWVAGVGNLSGLHDVDLSVEPFVGDSLFWDGNHWVAGVSNVLGQGDVDPSAVVQQGDTLVWDEASQLFKVRPTGPYFKTISLTATTNITLPYTDTNYYRISLGQNSTITLPNVSDVYTNRTLVIRVIIEQGNGTYSVTWNGNGQTVKWDASGSALAGANKTTMFTFTYVKGTTYWMGKIDFKEI